MNKTTNNLGGYSKINPFMLDIAVSRIDCLGKDIAVNVIRSGRKLKTRILLTSQDIEEIFNFFSAESEIPLEPGEFIVNVGDATFRGLYSEEGNSSFKILKKGAYSLLEQKRKPPRKMPRRKAPVRVK